MYPRNPNIVAHIYDREKTYGQLVISWRRIFLLPLKIFCAFAERDITELAIVADKVTATFTGRIIQKQDNLFVVEIYPTGPIVNTKYWHNVYTLKLPYTEKHPEIPTWLTEEGDYVRYIPMTPKLYNSQQLTLNEFLSITEQTLEDFTCNESIKYSGC